MEPSINVVAGIELAIYGADAHPGAPVVFVAHGRGGQKAHVAGYCADLVADGLIAIALDQRNHGSRLLDPAANGNWSTHHAADMYSSMVGTAQDVSLLIDMLPARLGIATDRVGMTGFSMGGHATLLAMVQDTRIAVGAAAIGSGDYRRLMELRAQENGTPAEEFPAYFPPAMDAAVRRFDPIHHPDRFANRPLLMTNGEDDTLVQIECNQRFYAAAHPHYPGPTRLRHTPHPGVAHAVPDAMWAELRAWLKQWLVG